MVCAPIHRCRVCGSGDIESVVNLGLQYIASVFIRDSLADEFRERYPLELVRCHGARGCGLVQLRHSIDPRLLYSDYGYLSGINEQMRANLKDIVSNACRMAPVAAGDRVLDIGCNDGTLLHSYDVPGLVKLGIDPAHKLVGIARQSGLEVINDFFSAEAVCAHVPGFTANIITSIAMFYDLEDPCGFARDVASLLAPEGVWVVELSYLPKMLELNSFDTICHEHLEYYALRQLDHVFRQAELRIHDVEFNAINGGSVRLYVRHEQLVNRSSEALARVEQAFLREQHLQLDGTEIYLKFKSDVESVRRELRATLRALKIQGKTVYIYGASTKGNTILQVCGVDRDLVPKAADRNPDKWGRRLLGTDIPIISEEQARAERPDYFLVLPWHFIETFKRREHAFLAGGGQFLMPLPKVEFIGR